MKKIVKAYGLVIISNIKNSENDYENMTPSIN